MTRCSWAPGLLLTALLAASCGGPPPPGLPAPPEAETGRFCPLPRTFAPGEPRPVRIRLENRTRDTLTVFLDRCYWHTRMADVPPGRTRQPELPARLVIFPEGLRFRAFDLSGMRLYGIYAVSLDGGPVLTLRLDDAGRVPPDSLVRFALDESQGDERVGTFAVRSDGGEGYAAVWATEGLAIATWSCSADRRGMAVTVPGEFGGDPVDVLVRRDRDADFEPLGRWTVQRTMGGGALVPPQDALAEVGRWFGGTSVVDFLVDDGGSRQVHRFRVAGLEEALASLGCWGGRPG